MLLRACWFLDSRINSIHEGLRVESKLAEGMWRWRYKENGGINRCCTEFLKTCCNIHNSNEDNGRWEDISSKKKIAWSVVEIFLILLCDEKYENRCQTGIRSDQVVCNCQA